MFAVSEAHAGSVVVDIDREPAADGVSELASCVTAHQQPHNADGSSAAIELRNFTDVDADGSPFMNAEDEKHLRGASHLAEAVERAAARA